MKNQTPSPTGEHKTRLLSLASDSDKGPTGNHETELLAHMTTTEGMAVVAEEGLGPEVFETPLNRYAFTFALEYWGRYQKAPTREVFVTERPGLKLPEVDPEDDDPKYATGWLVKQLQKRYVTNEFQEAVREAVKGSSSDPLGAFKALKDTADKVLSRPGNIGRGASYLRLLSVGGDIADDAPVWAWQYDGHGAIQLGTLGLLAGRPGAGKSTAARWFAAQFSQGKLPGYWSGQPQNVAYIAPAEESMKYVIKPGLRAAGADLERIFFPEVIDDGKVARLRSARDEDALVEQLLAHKVTVVVVDPLMGTIGTGVDIHRNNETREYLEPWARIADKIGGVVLGVVHLRKEARGGDVVAAITGSSAFGEVARSVFGFAKDPNSDCRVMSQVKNSTGPEDLSLAYRIESEVVTTDTGIAAQVGKFVIQGNSERTVADVLNEQRHQDRGPTAVDGAIVWLQTYLTLHGRTPSKQIKEDASKAWHSESTVKKAAKELEVVLESEGFPRVTYWSLPQDPQGPDQGPLPGRCPEQVEPEGSPVEGVPEQSVPVGSQLVQDTNVEPTEPTEDKKELLV
jgi:AAA domain